MIPVFFQDDLVEELSRVLSGLGLSDPAGNPSEVHVFGQSLPVPVVGALPAEITDEMLEEGTYHDAQTVDDPFPYVIVRLDQGKVEKIDLEQIVSVNLIIGVVDRAFNNQGHRDVLGIMERIYQRFAQNPVLNHEYALVMPINWVLQDEPSYPYFFGAMNLMFELIPIRREDAYT
jgi:hypothetical protein